MLQSSSYPHVIPDDTADPHNQWKKTDQQPNAESSRPSNDYRNDTKIP